MISRGGINGFVTVPLVKRCPMGVPTLVATFPFLDAKLLLKKLYEDAQHLSVN